MEIEISSNLLGFPTDFFIESVKFEKDDEQIPYFEIGRDGFENTEFSHWNGAHLRKASRPSKWAEFHTEELMRCVMQKLSPEDHRTSIIQQRTHILQAILRTQWTQSTIMDLRHENLNDGLRGRMLTVPGITPAGGEKWNRATEPVYGQLKGNTEWVIILDARTLKEITEGGISAGDLCCYSNGLRIVKSHRIPAEEIVPFSDFITQGRGVFLPEETILFWLNQALPFDRDVHENIPRYSPFMEIDGARAFSHPLQGGGGSSRARTKHDLCVLTGNIDQPLRLAIDKFEVELSIRFREEDDGLERLHAVGFVKTTKEKVEYLSIHPDQLGLEFIKENGDEVSATRKNVLKKELTYSTYRDLTKAFRICVKKQCNPEHSFTSISGIGISAYHAKWFRMAKNTKLEEEMKILILTINGWV